jgi:hypothetical protein
MRKNIAAAAFISALFAGGASAQRFEAPRYTLDESSIRIERLDDRDGSGGPEINPPLPNPPQFPVPQAGPEAFSASMENIKPETPGGGLNFDNINQTIGVIDNIVNLADKFWSIIDKSRPVVAVTTTYANAVPFGTSHWTQLQGWSKPSTKRYAFSIKNSLGSEVVKVVYQVHSTHGGNFQGKGKFLTGVTIEPLTITAPWGYTVDLKAEVPDSTVANAGTHEDPVASMQVQLKWKVTTAFSSIDQKVIYYLQGDGLIEEIGTPFKNRP